MKQALVIGLGKFGMSLARELTQRRVEVICVDTDEDLVQEAAEFATQAVELDATDEEGLGELHPERRDVCVCAIGQDSRDASILCTAILRQLGAKRIIARAYDRLHERILGTVGAHETVDPEREFGRRLAAQIAFRGVFDRAPLGNLEISEVAAPRSLLGKSLRELELPRRFGVYVVAIRNVRDSAEELRMPTPDLRLDDLDILVLAAKRGSLDEMLEKIG